jgi:AcrR family transcriptional regulator
VSAMASANVAAPQADAVSASRRKAFIGAARELFFINGYAGTSMSSIAAKVGGSKTTLWTYFPSKADLFAAVLDDLIDTYGQTLRVEMPEEEAVADVLRRFGRVLLATVTSPPMLSLYRLVVSEVERFPHLAELFYERGPRRGMARLAGWMAVKMQKGELRKGSPARAANDFVGLCQGSVYQHAILGLPEGTPGFAADVDVAVDTFSRGWSPGA